MKTCRHPTTDLVVSALVDKLAVGRFLNIAKTLHNGSPAEVAVHRRAAGKLANVCIAVVRGIAVVRSALQAIALDYGLSVREGDLLGQSIPHRAVTP